MVVSAVQACTGLGLLIVEDGEDAEDDGDARVEPHAHEAVGDGVGDVLEVHRLALDEDADGNDGVEGTARGGSGGERSEVGSGRGEEVAGRGAAGLG